MKLNGIKLISITLAITAGMLLCGNNISLTGEAATTATVAKPAAKQTAPAQTCDYVVSPVEVVNNPAKYLNKNISFNAEFVSYTALGLDYKPAFREATKYIGVLIKRNDVPDHVIPLSEMKLFLKRETAEKYSDLETGDKIKITGTVFSNALGDPWVDIKTFTVVEQKNKDKDKK